MLSEQERPIRLRNFELFIEAIYPLLNDDAKLDVVCTGGGKFSEMEIEKLKIKYFII